MRYRYFFLSHPPDAVLHRIVSHTSTPIPYRLTVVEGMDVVRRIEELPKDEKDRPLEPVVIADCGELPPSSADPTGDGSSNGGGAAEA